MDKQRIKKNNNIDMQKISKKPYNVLTSTINSCRVPEKGMISSTTNTSDPCQKWIQKRCQMALNISCSKLIIAVVSKNINTTRFYQDKSEFLTSNELAHHFWYAINGSCRGRRRKVCIIWSKSKLTLLNNSEKS